ncbi:MAG TPA: 3'(2'),5'-bisphosphate nucleotidase [Phycisphaerales bacterium]|nr:3'(2'),5'-bisphosphate nucleotidase [Phycisphaerales bacterium]
MDLPKTLVSALPAVKTACTIARAVQSDLSRVQQITKDDKSPVTVADFAVQASIALDLSASLGADLKLVGEEHTRHLRNPDQTLVLEAVVKALRSAHPSVTIDQTLAAIDLASHDASADTYWTLDPIDGTKGFLRGQQYAIALALIQKGKVVLGIMGCPNMSADFDRPFDDPDPAGVIFTAALGHGSYQQSLSGSSTAPIRIPAHHRTVHTGPRTIRVCESVEASHSKQDDTQRILASLGQPQSEPARLDSQGKYSVVARAQADAYLRLPTKKGYVEKIWDHAAGMLIAHEAGCVVTDISNQPLDFSHGRLLSKNSGIVCAAPDIHPRLIGAIADLHITVPA